MTRPPSIRLFDIFWWVSTILWAIGTLLAYKRVELTLASNAQTAAAARIAQPITAVVVVLATVLFWWLVRRGSPVGKWLVVVAAVLSGLQALIRIGGLATAAQSLHPASLALFLLSAALTVAAAVMLFRPDANQWFGLAEPEEIA